MQTLGMEDAVEGSRDPASLTLRVHAGQGWVRLMFLVSSEDPGLCVLSCSPLFRGPLKTAVFRITSRAWPHCVKCAQLCLGAGSHEYVCGKEMSGRMQWDRVPSRGIPVWGLPACISHAYKKYLAILN